MKSKSNGALNSPNRIIDSDSLIENSIRTVSQNASGHRKLQSQRIAEDIGQQILKGILQDGDRLDSELDLAHKHGVARGTMRNALDILKEKGLVVTKPGVGSFVSYHGHSMENPQGWAEASAQAGSPTVAEVISCTREPASEELQRAYGVENDVYRIVRRRIIKRNKTPYSAQKIIPVSIEISVLPVNRILDLIMEHGLLGDSISLTMQAAGMVPVSGVQDAHVGLAPEEYRQQLEASDKDNFLIVSKASFNENEDLVEYVVSYLNPQHFSLHTEFRRNNDTIN